LFVPMRDDFPPERTTPKIFVGSELSLIYAHWP
jgi:hypothetical protein